MKHLFLVVIAALFLPASNAISQDLRKPIDVVNNAKNVNATFQSVDLLNIDSRSSRTDFGIESTIREYNLFDVNLSGLKQINQSTPEAIEIPIPTTYRNNMDLELVKVDIYAHDFSVVRRSDNAEVEVKHGIHYRGIIKGDPTSLVAMSFYEDQIIGMISSDAGNLVIGKLNNHDKHIIYDDFNVITDLGLECGTVDDGIGYKAKDLRWDETNRAPGDCIRLYIEVDKDIHDNKGGVTGATNYVTGLLNQVITLYANENIQSVISQIVVWDITSPYSSTSSSGMLSDFQANINSINGIRKITNLFHFNK